jgi:nucleoside-diphosphate-sugar epimerase
MRVLFVGGTGNISRECVLESLRRGWEVSLLNRGNSPVPEGARSIRADIRDRAAAAQALRALRGQTFDAVADFIAYDPSHIETALDLFRGRTGQYVFISSASVYHKPLRHYLITESTPAFNPFWEYSQKKIACEQRLARAYAEEGFPMTVVRPSHTYSEGWFPTTFGSRDYTVAARMLAGKEIVVHGDGESLWTLTHSRDFAPAFAGLLGNAAAVGETFHITSDFVYTWNRIHLTIGAALGVEPKLVHVPSEVIARMVPSRGAGLLGDKAHCLVFDNSKVKRLVPGWAARIPWDEGARMSVDWYEAHPEKKVSDPAIDAEVESVLQKWHAMAERL